MDMYKNIRKRVFVRAIRKEKKSEKERAEGDYYFLHFLYHTVSPLTHPPHPQSSLGV